MSISLSLIVILLVHISMLSPLSPENSPKSHNYSTVKKFLLLKETLDRYLLLGLSSYVSQSSQAFFENLLLYRFIFQKLTKISCLTALV